MTVAEKPNAPIEERPREVRIVAHTMLFYWWPVWAVGLLLFGLSWLGGHRLAIVPAGTQVVEGFDGGREALVLPAGAHLPKDPATGKPREPTLRVASRSGYGVVFIVVVLLVIFITNVPVRGLWSVIAILMLLLVTVLLALAGRQAVPAGDPNAELKRNNILSPTGRQSNPLYERASLLNKMAEALGPIGDLPGAEFSNSIQEKLAEEIPTIANSAAAVQAARSMAGSQPVLVSSSAARPAPMRSGPVSHPFPRTDAPKGCS
jgi:hypothetical protein